MTKGSKKEQLLLLLVCAPMTVLGLLAGSQLTNYFQITNELGGRAFMEPQWVTATLLMISYSIVGCVAGMICTRCLGKLLDHSGLK